MNVSLYIPYWFEMTINIYAARQTLNEKMKYPYEQTEW